MDVIIPTVSKKKKQIKPYIDSFFFFRKEAKDNLTFCIDKK